MLSEVELQQQDSSRVGTSINADPRCKFAVPASSSSNAGSAKKKNVHDHDSDLLVVFEDDVDVGSSTSIAELGPALIRELDQIDPLKTDLHFLGWCYGKGLRSMPMCAHAYVLTRKMVKLLVEEWEPCGLAVDGQWQMLYKERLFKWSKAHPESFNGPEDVSLLDELESGGGGAMKKPSRKGRKGKEKEKEREKDDGEYFHGMFKQANLGSFNDHAWMPNANE